MVELDRSDGGKTTAYHAEVPAGVQVRGGVVVLQEWWGLNDHLRSIADRLAAEGFEALAPDLYHGKVATNAMQAQKLMVALDGADAVQQDVRAAARWLVARGRRVAVVGFCLGGALAISSAVHVPELSAAVCFYGIPPAERADPRDNRVPMLAHFAERDQWCTPERVASLEAALRSAGPPLELHRYPAEHAFFNDTRPDVYDPAAAALAWERTIAFLARSL